MREQWSKKVNISNVDNEILHTPNPKTINDIDEICGNHLLEHIENCSNRKAPK
jgi:hypothetical protein